MIHRLNDAIRAQYLLSSGNYKVCQNSQTSLVLLNKGPGTRSHHTFIWSGSSSWCMYSALEVETQGNQDSAAGWKHAAGVLGSILQLEYLNLHCLPRQGATELSSHFFDRGYHHDYNEDCFRYSITTDAMGALELTASEAPNVISLVPERPEYQMDHLNFIRTGSSTAPSDEGSPLTSTDAAETAHGTDILDHHEGRVHARVKVIYEPLCLKDANIVNDTWHYKSSTSLDLIHSIITSNRTMCARLVPVQPSDNCRTDMHVHVACNQRTSKISDQSTVLTDGADCGKGKESSSASCEGPHHEPVAWVVQYHDGSIGMAYTQPHARRQGLMSACMAKLILQILDDQIRAGVVKYRHGYDESLIDKGMSLYSKRLQGALVDPSSEEHAVLQKIHSSGWAPQVFAFAVHTNTASQSMLSKLGFRNVGEAIWMGMKKVAE